MFDEVLLIGFWIISQNMILLRRYQQNSQVFLAALGINELIHSCM